MKNILCLLPWLLWIVGYPLYKYFRDEDLLESRIFIPVMWVLCIVGNVASWIIFLCKLKFNF